MARTAPSSDSAFPPPSPGEDVELDAVTTALAGDATVLGADPDGYAFAHVLRDTYDWLYDGQRTGRYCWDQLRKTEKTHMGTLVEIELQREFDIFMDGGALDYRIAGIDVDCKFSQQLGGWEIPSNMRRDQQICLLVWANEEVCRFEVGLVRARLDDESWFYNKPNQDKKRKLSQKGESTVRWLYPGASLPSNQLLHLSGVERDSILGATGPTGRASGQACIDQLFRVMSGQIVRRNTVLTVARQKDAMKRVREAREPGHLGGEGFLLLCGDWRSHRSAAHTLSLPELGEAEFVAVRVTAAQPTDAAPAVGIDGSRWRLARPGDQVESVPQLPLRN